VLGELLPAEFPGVDLRPGAIELREAPRIEVQLPLVNVTGLQVDMNMGVLGVLMDDGDGSRLRERAVQVLLGHPPRPLGLDSSLEGEHRPVVGADLPMSTSPWSAPLVLLRLAAELLQVVPQLPIRAGVSHVLGIVPNEDRLPVALRRHRARDIAGVGGARPCAPGGEAGEDPGH